MTDALCNASRSTLIIIDLQERLMPVIADAAEILKRATILTQAAILLDIPIIVTTQQPLRLGATVAPIQQALQPNTPVIEKAYFNACAAPDFLSLLSNNQNDLILMGCESHICVLQTALGLLNQKRRVKLVIDAIGSRQHSNKAIAIERAKTAGAELVTSEMVIFEWLQNSHHPRFKEILKLVK